MQTILFTTDEEVLDAVSRNDDAFEGDMLSEGEEDIPLQRPRTADNEESDEVSAVSFKKQQCFILLLLSNNIKCVTFK